LHLSLNPASVADYRRFLAVKRLPIYRIRGGFAEFPDEYAAQIGELPALAASSPYVPGVPGLFDYQRDITALSLRKRKFAVFADCGLGKTMILLEYMRHVLGELPRNRKALIVSPLMVIRQTIREAERWYRLRLPIEQVAARDLADWLRRDDGSRLGITNYDGMHEDLPQGNLGALGLDESSMLKSMYGKWGQACIKLGRGLDWKLCLTGTPAPNDRIEYGNHAVFLDQVPTLNAFLAKYFVNRGQTDNRWELKPHAIEPFYRSLSHWCIFLTNPATYGWRDNCDTIPPIHVHIHDVELTEQQQAALQESFGEQAPAMGGITKRSVLGQIGKGIYRGAKIETRKQQFIRDLVDSWPMESTIIWCIYNQEQEELARIFPEAADVTGDTPYEERLRLVGEFMTGRRRVLLTKPKILGFGQNLQIATRQIFSGLQDSYESYYQAVKRSNRYGSTRPLNVHIPVTSVERPMIETVLRKAKMVQQDTETQERLFKGAMLNAA
jgi:hypothetical protein